MKIKEVERKYFDSLNYWKLEEDILYSFSKKDLKAFIDTTKEHYFERKISYTYFLANIESRSWYKQLSEFDKYYIEKYEYIFNWWEELNKTQLFISRLETFYKLNYVKAKHNNFKRIDINWISIKEVLWMYMKLPNNLRRNIKCPLHNEKTGSFRIYENSNSWYCYWCNKWWNVVTFISEIEKVSSKEAFKKLCNLYW